MKRISSIAVSKNRGPAKILWISLTVQDTALLTIAVPSAIAALAPAQHIAALALLVSVSNVAAMLVPPLAGWFSDRGRRRGGTRRPWIAAGVAVDVVALVALSYAHSLVAFDALFILAVAAENVAIAAYQAMIPEVVPRSSWGAASGMRGAATLIGTVAGLGVAGAIVNVRIVFLLAAVLLVLGTLTLFAAPEREWVAPERATVTRWHDFIVVFVARGFVFFGLALLMTFVLYFFRDVLAVGNPGAGTAAVGIFSLLGAIVSSVVLGFISDRVPRKYIVAACGVPMAIAALGFAIAPEPSAIFAFAALFGIGLGGILSVGWALAIDSLPQLSDVARDLGIWGIATNLPAVVAPVLGGWVLSAFGGTRLGYQVIFALAGLSFALGAVTVLRVGAKPLSSLWGMPVWNAAMLSVAAYTGIAHRVRGWGRMSRRRGATLVVINHQHPIESTTIVSRLGVQSSWRHPVFTSTGRRMWEPGFFVVEFPWLPGFMRNVSPGPLFTTLGFMPIENQLYARPIASLALAVHRERGALRIAEVFSPESRRDLRRKRSRARYAMKRIGPSPRGWCASATCASRIATTYCARLARRSRSTLRPSRTRCGGCDVLLNARGYVFDERGVAADARAAAAPGRHRTDHLRARDQLRCVSRAANIDALPHRRSARPRARRGRAGRRATRNGDATAGDVARRPQRSVHAG